MRMVKKPCATKPSTMRMSASARSGHVARWPASARSLGRERLFAITPPAIVRMIVSRVISSPTISPTLLPVPQDRDPVAHGDDLIELGRRHEQRQALLAQPTDQRHHLGMGADVDAARRFVENQDARLRDQPAGQHHLLLVAARQLPHRLVRVGRGDGERLDHLLGEAFLFLAGEPAQPAALGLQRQHDVLAHAEFADQCLPPCDPPDRSRSRGGAIAAASGGQTACRPASVGRRRGGSAPKMSFAVSVRPGSEQAGEPDDFAGAQSQIERRDRPPAPEPFGGEDRLAGQR